MMQLKELDLDLIEREASKAGLDPFKFLRAVMGLVSTSTTTAPTEPSAKADEPVGRLELFRNADICEKLYGYISGMALGDQTDAYALFFHLSGQALKSRGQKRTWTYHMSKCPGLEVVRTPSGETRDRKTAWGNSPVFTRVPLITDQRARG
jgi:hypothetical protein